MDGLLLIDKPKGWTSFDVVAKVRSLIKQQTGLKRPKVGHTGTLDPLATGLLVLCVGSYCKRAQEFSRLDKTYQVELTLGQTSTTDDDEGEKTATGTEIPDKDTIREVILSFSGVISQVPPAFSAIKVNGNRAYKLAREGKKVEMKARKITIYAIEDIITAGTKVTFTATVSSGTYIRSLARDIGVKLGCGAFMSNLRRTSVGNFQLVDATPVEAIAKSIDFLLEI